MKKNFYTLIFLGLFATGIAQTGNVGINTTTPSATLDVTGSPADATKADGLIPPRITGNQLAAKDSMYGTNQNGTIIYATAAVTTSTPKTTNVTAPGYYYYDSLSSTWKSLNGNSGSGSGTGTAMYAMKDGAWSLLGLGISGTDWNKIDLTSTDVKAGNSASFVNGVYTAPEAGIYEVNYEFQLEGGVDLGLLGGKVLGIIKNGTTVYETKIFDAVRVSILGVTLAAVPVTSSSLNTMIQLNPGETITFGVETGGISLGLLTDGKVKVSVSKVSN
ncbi:hypothetical protein PFY12_15975 [Chryseobacterium camelliae]|uniref:C1q domain-containing protein n=1 Tax=Chryseobacterium camelliae TaxID=1265445 RepID=A0ABY7QLI0_9FLAO|nr:hypothetical protein [Chryseobacterium camelliae]WBV60515.1 hypothetical protein PFY12_15975 [Chryseobacterium camelliae]